MVTRMVTNYAEDIEQHWKYKESQRPKFRFSSPQISVRSELVEWLRNVSTKLNVSYRTIHLAMYLLDMFMDNHSITIQRLGFVALVCLMLAVKFEEIDVKVPTISEMNKYDGFRYSNKDFIRIEVMVLKCLDFDLTQPTVAHFAEYYIMVGILPQDLRTSKYSPQRLNEISRRVIMEFLDICLKEEKFLMIRPSQTAAACVFATRYVMNLSPAWNVVLSSVTGYKEEDIISCVNILITGMNQREARGRRSHPSPDSGYITESP